MRVLAFIMVSLLMMQPSLSDECKTSNSLGIIFTFIIYSHSETIFRKVLGC